MAFTAAQKPLYQVERVMNDYIQREHPEISDFTIRLEWETVGYPTPERIRMTMASPMGQMYTQIMRVDMYQDEQQAMLYTLEKMIYEVKHEVLIRKVENHPLKRALENLL